MNIVINIDEEVYKRTLPYKDLPVISNLANDYPELIHAVANGTPLPKGHGDLVDTTYFEHYLRDTYIDSVSFKRAISAMKRLSTIIEADKEQTDGKDNS